MPRKSKGARLYYRPARKGRKATYVIRDGKHEFSTGTDDSGAAERALALYVNSKNAPSDTDGPLTVAQALTKYGEDKLDEVADPERLGYAISALDEFWGDMPIDKISPKLCKKYAEKRNRADGTIRRELGALTAAVRHVLPSGSVIPNIWLPEKPAAKDRWLTRSEAALLIRIARRHAETRHLAPFILVALYTGTRKMDILRLKFEEHGGGGYVDTKAGRLHRKAKGAPKTKKRAPEVRIPRRLLAHLRRWEKMSPSGWVIEFRGCGVGSIKTAWNTLRTKTGLNDVTPHTLKHTAITWAMQARVDHWDACGFFGITMETLMEVYAHHHPDYQVDVANKVGRGGRAS